jgi:hypothetical protein
MDSLKVVQHKNGSYELQWDKQDPMWKFLNHLTDSEIQVILRQAIQEDLKDK